MNNWTKENIKNTCKALSTCKKLRINTWGPRGNVEVQIDDMPLCYFPKFDDPEQIQALTDSLREAISRTDSLRAISRTDSLRKPLVDYYESKRRK